MTNTNKTKGFLIKCMECGKETFITEYKNKEEFKYSNKNIQIVWSNMEETYIRCKCGNKLIDL